MFWPSGQAVFTNSSGFVQVQVFFEPDTEGPFGPPNVCVGLVVITQDIVDSSTLVLQGSLVHGRHNLGAQCVGTCQLCGTDVMRLVDLSKLFGETCYVGISQHRAPGVGAIGPGCDVVCSVLAGPGDL